MKRATVLSSENDLKHGFRFYFGKMNESVLT
jgi:hypothetical protein